MSSFNTRATSLKTKASVGARAADVLKHCEKLEKQQTHLKTLLTEANDTDMYNHVLDSHLYAIANMIPNFKTTLNMGFSFGQTTKPVKSTFIDPLTDKINILRDFIKHSTTQGMMDYKFPEKRQAEKEAHERMQEAIAHRDRSVVQKLEDMARTKAQQSSATNAPSAPQPFMAQPAPQPFGAQPAPQPFGAQPAQQMPPFGTSSVQTGSPAFIGLVQTSNSVPQQPTVASASGPAHPPIKRPRFASTPKSKQ
jgi:hypothetical protein